MRQLTIDWYALEAAFDDDDEFGTDRANYLDVETGELVFVDDEISSTVSLIVDELQESLGEADWTDEVIRETDAFQQLSKEEQPSVLAAMKIDYGDYAHGEIAGQVFARVVTRYTVGCVLFCTTISTPSA